MNDEELVARLDSFGPVPGCQGRPAGLTRLLALRLHALCRAPGLSVRYTASQGPNSEVLASDLGPVLLRYLNTAGIGIELKEVLLVGESMASCRGLVVLNTFVSRLLPRSIAQFYPPLKVDRLPGALKMPISITIWAMAGEIHRKDPDQDEIPKLVERACEVAPEWCDAYPELRDSFEPPPPELPVTPPSLVAPPLRSTSLDRQSKRRQRGQVWTLTDEAQIQDRLNKLSSRKERNSGIDKVLKGLSLHCVRHLEHARQRQAVAVEQLEQRFPNFVPVCQWVADQIRLCALMHAPLRLPPVLLLGPPGIGKTMFCIELAQTLGAEVCIRSLGEMTASWLITGTSTQWNNGRPGVVAEHLSQCPKNRIPWFIFDELDKATGDRGFPVGPALLGLLEPYTAQRFRDEALEVEMDIRPAGFIFTANELERVRPELISRLHVISVPAPTAFEMPAVVASVDAQLRKEQPGLNKIFAPIGTEVLLHLEAQPPRELRRYLQLGYANAARRMAQKRGRRVLLPQDLPSGSGRSHFHDRKMH